MDFSAGILLGRKLLDELLKDGHALIPTQWIETDRNEHVADTKSRHVGCGQSQDTNDIRADAPTCPVE
eukprot:10849102-Karenia_brevis.AAC.1